MLNLGDLRPKPIARFDSSIGQLAIYAISDRDLTELMVSVQPSAIDATAFVKQLIRYTCHRLSDPDAANAKPDAPSLQLGDVESLGDEEIEQIAGIYLDAEEHLYRKEIVRRKEDADGTSVVSFEYGDVEHSRKKGESNVKYLHRLMVLCYKEQEERLRSMLRSVLGSAQFASGISEQIARTLHHGESLTRMAKAMQTPDFSRFTQTPLSDALRDSGYRPFLDRRISSEIRPFTGDDNRGLLDPIRENLDQLVQLTREAVQFSVESNTTQTKISATLKQSQEKASRFNRRHLAITVAVLIVAVVSLWNQCAYQGAARNSQEAVDRADIHQ